MRRSMRGRGRIPSPARNAVVDPKRIVLVRLSHLGDVVHALGVFHALHAAYPAAEIAWAIQTEFAELVADLPGLTRTIHFDRRGGPAAWWRLRRELLAFAPDWAVDAQGNSKSAVVTRLAGAARRFGLSPADRQEPWLAGWSTDLAPPVAGPERHAMRRMEALVRVTVPLVHGPLRLDAALSAAELARGEDELRARFPAPLERPLLVHLSVPGDIRAWPPERWLELIRAARATGRAVGVLSGPAEAALGAELAAQLAPDPLVVHWIAQRGLRQLAAVFQVAARRGWTLVACDSGPMHLAAAHGLEVIALEGPQDGARTGPWPLERHRVVRSSRPLPCAPCLARRCQNAEGPVCMSSLGAAEVLAALERSS
jgi:ADP-heptose:LPS heptosyltransferase